MTCNSSRPVLLLMVAVTAFAMAMPADAFPGGVGLPRLDFPNGDAASRACNNSALPVCTESAN